MISTSIPNVGTLEEKYLKECIDSTMVSTHGSFVKKFEMMLGEYLQTEEVVATCSGTSALHASLLTCGVKKGDLVILPSLTFIATANAISYCGAKPWILDINPESWLLDLDLLENILKTKTVVDECGVRRHKLSKKRVKAIVPVLVLGLTLDLKRLEKIKEVYGLSIVVDAAAALGSKPKQKNFGVTKLDAFCFSFNGNKIITCGGGGAVSSSDSNFLKKVKHLTTTARTGKNYDHDLVGYNYRMTNVAAAIGLAQLSKLPQFLKRKKEISDAYTKFVDNYRCLEAFPISQFGEGNNWLSGFIYVGNQKSLPDKYRRFMEENGVQLNKFWKPIHLQKPYKDCLSALNSTADKLWWRIFTLPCSSGLKNEELSKVLSLSKHFWEQNNF